VDYRLALSRPVGRNPTVVVIEPFGCRCVPAVTQLLWQEEVTARFRRPPGCRLCRQVERRLPRRFVQILTALASTAAVAAFPPAASALGDCAPAADWPAARPDLAAQVVDLINVHRAEMGLKALSVSPTLTAAATWKARHMAAYGYLTHDDPGPPMQRTAGDRMAACSYPQATWGENIAMGYTTAQAVVDAWLASPGHRANIERADFVATGVAMAGTAQPYWAESFGSLLDGGATALSATPEQHSAASLTPAARSSSTGRTVRVSCERSGQRISCRVRNGRGATVRIAIRRSGHTFARVLRHVGSDDLRVRLHTVRRLHVGRYDLVVRTSAPAGTHERRRSFVV
jgi:uncharacterized protein YkwD